MRPFSYTGIKLIASTSSFSFVLLALVGLEETFLKRSDAADSPAVVRFATFIFLGYYETKPTSFILHLDYTSISFHLQVQATPSTTLSTVASSGTVVASASETSMPDSADTLPATVANSTSASHKLPR